MLSANIVDELKRSYPDAAVVYRDLTAEAIPHLDGGIAAGFRETGVKEYDAETLAEHARSQTLVEEFLASDVIVIGAPMYNFSVPSQLKAWIDRVAQVGRTFKYTETGPVGLSGGRRVIVASTRGGMYSSGPAAVMDYQEAYLKAFFGFLGIANVKFVQAERLSRGGEVRGDALRAAQASIQQILIQSAAT
ncbi:FMN-dependent NADH-azoreductase [Bradyrhizobium sp. SSBR45G]|nr:FMN-dependent NADH-azoreductase [Bradyrhizobium sp. SSBR45G]GLH84283.1 FMN-dependent NADH-azoreductase [Bradyrhizobium sp. SSBR45R]